VTGVASAGPEISRRLKNARQSRPATSFLVHLRSQSLRRDRGARPNRIGSPRFVNDLDQSNAFDQIK